MTQPRTLAAPPPLVLTGERTLPGIPDENYWFRRHEAAYLALTPYVIGAHVLEAGSGEGYGARLLAASAIRVTALDNDAAAVAHAGRSYPGLPVVRADLQRLPVADGAVEAVATLQVIEHLWDQPGFIAECARVLRPAGTLLLSTPNRLTFSPGSAVGDPPLNPFHTRELSATELLELIAPHFVVTRLLGLGHGRRITRFERRHGSLVGAQLAGQPETWTGASRRLVHAVQARDFVISPAVSSADVDRALDLIVVARRRTSADPVTS